METGTILIVDDEESIRFTFRSFLEEKGHSVATAIDYPDAMRQIEKAEFDLAFIDIVLGGRSGIELLHDLKEMARATEVIIVTGAPDLESASSALRYGALDYIVKPVRQDTLLRAADLGLKQKALKDSEEKYRSNMEAIFRSVKDVIIMVDGDSHVVEANDAVSTLCKTNREDILGQPVGAGELECSASCFEALRETMASTQAVTNRRVECLAQHNRNQIANVTATPLVASDGLRSGGVMVIRDETRLSELERSLLGQSNFPNIVGRSREIKSVLSMVEALADVQTSVLLTGESGTGKELIAEALHAAGGRADKPLVKVNCSALSENLLESELFGHVRGAFTGADRNKIGRFERAHGGTIFLDEIGEITPRMQLRFLRVLETMEFERVGESAPISVDVRVIAATNRDLRECVREGNFREDLYYRLKVVEIEMPALRTRQHDIPLLIQHFIDRFNTKFSKEVLSVSDKVMDLFMSYAWPGNVRELENVLEHAFVLSHAPTLTQRDLPVDFLKTAGGSLFHEEDGQVSPIVPMSRVIPLEELERRYLDWAVENYKGENNGLARELGLSERTFYRKLRRLRNMPVRATGEPDHH